LAYTNLIESSEEANRLAGSLSLADAIVFTMLPRIISAPNSLGAADQTLRRTSPRRSPYMAAVPKHRVRSARTIDSCFTLLCQATHDLMVPTELTGGTVTPSHRSLEVQRLVMMTGSDAASSDPAWTSCRSKCDDLCSESSCANVRSESAKWAKAEVDQACCRIVSSVLLTCGH
jgi:hypothetical protein